MKTTATVQTQVLGGSFFGIAKGLSHQDHIAAREYLSNSGMGPLLRSPAHYQAYINEQREATKSQNMGTATHLAIVERALDRVVVAPTPDQYPNALKTADDLKSRCKELGLAVSGSKAELIKRIREKDSGVILWDDIESRFEAQSIGKVIVSKDEMESLIGMSKAVHAHPEASLCFAGGIAETSIFWQDPEFGVKCKARPDYVKASTLEVIDLKTTEDASTAFSKSAFNYGYFRQAAFYSDGIEAVYGFRPTFKIVAVEKKAPYGVAVFKLTDAALHYGRLEYRKALKIYAECVAVGEWPSYWAGVQLLDVPEFAW